MERFADFMVKDVKTGECYRADHLIEGECCVVSLAACKVPLWLRGRLSNMKS